MNRSHAVGVALVLALARCGQAGAAPAFRTEVSAVLSRAGCNSGSCHGAFTGKNGFRLSLFAHEPDADFAQITREAYGRRVDRIDGRESLFLRKATSQVPHAGGDRLPRGSQA